MCSSDPLFSFSHIVTKTAFAFLWRTGKMNSGKKHFDLTRGNAVAGTREVSKGGPGRPAFGTRSCLQGLVCYTFCSARRASHLRKVQFSFFSHWSMQNCKSFLVDTSPKTASFFWRQAMLSGIDCDLFISEKVDSYTRFWSSRIFPFAIWEAQPSTEMSAARSLFESSFET